MDRVLESMRVLTAATPERWIGMAQALPVELLARPAAEGEWPAVECLQHLVDSEQVLQFRVQAFLGGRDVPDFNPETDGSKPGGQTPLALAEEFARMRRESLGMLEKPTPADLERKVRHAELGLVTLNEMVHHWAAHDLNHTVQAPTPTLPKNRGGSKSQESGWFAARATHSLDSQCPPLLWRDLGGGEDRYATIHSYFNV